MVDEGTKGSLYVVSTPIGNMGDFTFRAVEVLRSVAAVLAEDTRHSRHLMDRFEIATPLVPYHEHNEARATPGLIARLQQGESLALISDAGTPLLSDPGFRLVRAAADAGLPVVPVPGASALLAALVASGIDARRFTFYGFLPRKGGERQETIGEMIRVRHASVFYESPNRLAATLAELAQAGAAERNVAVARELTKQYEELRRGTVGEVAAYYTSSPPRGEVVVVLEAAAAPAPLDEDAMRARVRELRALGLRSREIVDALMADAGAARNLAYRLAHEETA